MSLHYGNVKEFSKVLMGGKVQYQAYCQCDWTGPLRDAEATAANDAIRHELHSREPGPYA